MSLVGIFLLSLVLAFNDYNKKGLSHETIVSFSEVGEVCNNRELLTVQ